MTPLLGIVCGMEAEAAALGAWRDDPRLAVEVTGGRPERAEAAAARLADADVLALLSWGIAGGLDPSLGRGTLVVPDGVIVPGGLPFAFDPELVAACRSAAPAEPPGAGLGTASQGRPPATLAPHPDPAWATSRRPGSARAGRQAPGSMPGMLLIAGSDAVLLSPAAKAALRKRTGAAAVDMESHRVAAAARVARVPVLAVRAVSDRAAGRLPALAAHALDPEGRPQLRAVLAGLVRRPWDLPALLAAGRDSRAALSALAVAAEAVIPALVATLEQPGA